MAYRVLIAQFMHETNTFSKLPTTLLLCVRALLHRPNCPAGVEAAAHTPASEPDDQGGLRLGSAQHGQQLQ